MTPEFARQLTELSFETRRQIGALIDRKGYVEYVIVGDARRIELPDLNRTRVAADRFRGLRCVHTHLRGEELTQDDLTDLALLRLDLMVSLDVDAAHGTSRDWCARRIFCRPPSPNSTTATSADALCFPRPADSFATRRGFSRADQFARRRNGAQPARRRAAPKAQTARFSSASPPARRYEAEESMAELHELATSADVVVLDSIIQRRSAIDPRTVLGRGKLEELLVRALQLGADLIVFDRELPPAQVRSLSEATDLKVIDRSQLILDIFAQRAQSREGKIQVELAQLKYLLPRLIAGQDSAFSRLAGGIGGRGPGETKLETDRRRVRDRINRLEKEIDSLSAQRRQERRKERRAANCPSSRSSATPTPVNPRS